MKPPSHAGFPPVAPRRLLFGTRSLPLFSFGGSGGKSDSMIRHNSSLTRAAFTKMTPPIAATVPAAPFARPLSRAAIGLDSYSGPMLLVGALPADR